MFSLVFACLLEWAQDECFARSVCARSLHYIRALHADGKCSTKETLRNASLCLLRFSFRLRSTAMRPDCSAASVQKWNISQERPLLFHRITPCARRSRCCTTQPSPRTYIRAEIHVATRQQYIYVFTWFVISSSMLPTQNANGGEEVANFLLNLRVPANNSDVNVWLQSINRNFWNSSAEIEWNKHETKKLGEKFSNQRIYL